MNLCPCVVRLGEGLGRRLPACGVRWLLLVGEEVSGLAVEGFAECGQC
jgi:hypothetical protein